MGQKRDRSNIIGKQFGEWTVLYPIRNEKGKLLYHCKCSCGTERNILRSTLNSGKTKSCGCQKGKKISQLKMKDISNQRFGRLVALDIAYRKPPKTYWNCICDCGNYIVVEINSLTMGNTKSCGCLQKESRGKSTIHNLVGQTFGMLTVVEKTSKRTKTGNVIWLCQCECGNYKEVSGTHLLGGDTTSCGCINSKGEAKIAKLLQALNIKYIPQYIFSDCRFQDSNYPARFDFYLPNYKLCIEYNGEQHYHERKNGFFSLEEVKKIQERDKTKEQYCIKNHISLLIIPYYDYSKLTKEYLLHLINISIKGEE